MHATSLENMQKCYDRYVRPSSIERNKTVVLEMGSANINGGYRAIFSHPSMHYCGADLIAASGVDLVLKSPYEIPLPDGHADVVISGQMLEHSAYFWLLFQEMVRVLKEDGILFVIAPSAGPIHRFPVDCYRFYPDAYKALADLSGCHLVDCWLDDRGPWKDLVGVFSKQRRARWQGVPKSDRRNPETLAAVTRVSAETGGPVYEDRAEINVVSGASDYLELLKTIHRELAP